MSYPHSLNVRRLIEGGVSLIASEAGNRVLELQPNNAGKLAFAKRSL